MTATQINNKIANGTVITICPWDSAWTNQATATVIAVEGGRRVSYQVDDATITRQVSFGTWRCIVEQASRED